MSEQRFTLDTFDVETFRFQNVGKTVYSKGTGPGVVVLAEMPRIHPLVIRFAERVADAGFKVTRRGGARALRRPRRWCGWDVFYRQFCA